MSFQLTTRSRSVWHSRKLTNHTAGVTSELLLGWGGNIISNWTGLMCFPVWWYLLIVCACLFFWFFSLKFLLFSSLEVIEHFSLSKKSVFGPILKVQICNMAVNRRLQNSGRTNCWSLLVSVQKRPTVIVAVQIDIAFYSTNKIYISICINKIWNGLWYQMMIFFF